MNEEMYWILFYCTFILTYFLTVSMLWSIYHDQVCVLLSSVLHVVDFVLQDPRENQEPKARDLPAHRQEWVLLNKDKKSVSESGVKLTIRHSS